MTLVFRVHPVDQGSIAIFYVDFCLHRPGLRIERVSKTRNPAFKCSIQCGDADLYNGSQVNLRQYRGARSPRL